MRLGEMLIARGQLAQDELERALELQSERGDKLGRILIDLGFLSHRDLMAALSEQLGVPLAKIEGPPLVTPETERLNARFLRHARALPLRMDGTRLVLAMADPLDFETLSAVRSVTGLTPRAELALESEIVEAIDRYYGEEEKDADEIGRDDEAAGADLEHLRDMASEAPVIRLVNAMIAQAVEKRASDIHIEPFEKEFRVRFRVDGVLLRPGAAAARAEGRHHLAREADGEAEHRRAPPAAGRPHQDQDRWAAKWTCASPRCPRSTAKAS